MEGGIWQATVHGVAESDTTEHWERKGARAGYPGVPNIITSILISGRETLESQCQRDVVWERRDWMLLALKVGNEPPAKKCGQPPEAENHPWLMTSKKMVVEFQTTKFVVICFNNNKKLYSGHYLY